MESLEDTTDLLTEKIVVIEKNIESAGRNIIELQDTLLSLSAELKETQKFLIKLAQNQAIISTQVAQWPYVAVPTQKKQPKNRKNDQSE